MTKSTDAADREHMARALTLAERGLYDTDPNPTVGCVLVKGGQVVGEGWTAPAGGPHAERVALAAAGANARGATAYVTLEPCNHTGRTGPCTEALIEAGVARVICAMLDPNPLVSGAGVERLEAAGIPVTVGMLHASAEPLNRGYLARMTRKRPWMRVKIAATLDGRTALANGVSRWITGVAARRDVHVCRARSSAVLTGIGTILADDPSLTVRLEGEGINVLQPSRVILDSRLRTPPSAKTLELPGDVLIFGGRDEGEEHRLLTAAGASIERVPTTPHCDLHAVLARLAELEYNDVFVEAGPRVSGALLRAALVDELVIYFAPDVLGDGARGMFDVGVITDLEQRYRLEIDDVTRLGSDLRIVARPSTVAGA
jgi:diaminohydroxyphosphoribosylaminopyrimidine deaminase / 5-amino-6-(5-phosphoribosylamino)uracil reductase